ncbi:Phosphatidate cytidylyltransferase, mitochondrial [Dichanthelium oligosanthes]|uniref:Phosphatidate cytidylyltransferase, mitochondrial n=1 Tax=Dichanthelium oligosanthes TaxID=888268 RepID=A0A1E5VFU7_9POAL|nr:Phosphatidate cytidylyltransferase, mitochondrial [Dichanthelium oligosanthes]
MHAAAPEEEEERAAELAGPLRDLLPPVDFCCAYGSTLLHARPDGTSMVDYILGVADPLRWHSENLERNPAHYSRWMARLGAGAITGLADRVGVGVYFNPFVEWRDKRIKYGVVRMKDLAMDVLTWDRFYLSGRLQKPVHVLVDNWDIRKVNTINLEMATSASLLLLPEEFNEYDLYAQICSLSYMGDLRMLFAEDKNKDGGPSTTNELFSVLPWTIQRQLQGRSTFHGKEMPTRTVVSSKDMAANCLRKALRSRVMVSSARQAASGLLASGGAVAAQYLAKKMAKAWQSRAA